MATTDSANLASKADRCPLQICQMDSGLSQDYMMQN